MRSLNSSLFTVFENFPKKSHFCTKPTFYPEIPLIFIFQKCKFCEKCDFRNVNFVKSVISVRLILQKLGFSICELLDKMWIFALVCEFWNNSLWYVVAGFLVESARHFSSLCWPSHLQLGQADICASQFLTRGQVFSVESADWISIS